MNGNEFIVKIRKIAKARGGEVRFSADHGKGSHARLWYGTAMTVVKDRRKEIGPGLLVAMLRQLGLNKKDLE